MEIGNFGELSFTKKIKRAYPIKGEPDYQDWGFVMFGEIIDMDDKYILFKGNDDKEDIHLVNKQRIRNFTISEKQ